MLRLVFGGSVVIQLESRSRTNATGQVQIQGHGHPSIKLASSNKVCGQSQPASRVEPGHMLRARVNAAQLLVGQAIVSVT